VCLAIPVRVTALLEHGWVETDRGGVPTRVSTAQIDAVAVGDYLIVHAGFALNRLDAAEARITLALFREIIAVYERSVTPPPMETAGSGPASIRKTCTGTA
jgi:hydrogenase expression/formation protein HypC